MKEFKVEVRWNISLFWYYTSYLNASKLVLEVRFNNLTRLNMVKVNIRHLMYWMSFVLNIYIGLHGILGNVQNLLWDPGVCPKCIGICLKPSSHSIHWKCILILIHVESTLSPGTFPSGFHVMDSTYPFWLGWPFD